MTTLIARKYRYADGRVYQANRYVLLALDDGEYRTVGGALVLKDKAIAFNGMPIGDGHSATKIVKYAKNYAWGRTLAEALASIRPAIENRVS